MEHIFSHQSVQFDKPFYIYGAGGRADFFLDGIGEKQKTLCAGKLISGPVDADASGNIMQYKPGAIAKDIPIVICSYAYEQISDSLISSGHESIYVYHEGTYPGTTPITNILIIMKRCNVTCSFCAISPEERKEARDWTIEDVINALDANPYATDTYFSGGEPILHKDIARFIEEAKKRGQTTHMLSNGLNHKKIATYENLDQVVYSVSSVNNDLQKRYIPVDLKDLEASIKHVLSQPHGMSVSFNVALHQKNFDGAVDMVRFASERGVGSIIFNAITPYDWNPKYIDDESLFSASVEQCRRYLDLLEEVKQVGVELGVEVGVNEAMIHSLEEKLGQRPVGVELFECANQEGMTRFCLSPWFMMNYSNEGNIYPCCGGGRAQKLAVGNLLGPKDYHFNNNIMQRFRDGLLTGDMVPMCQTCFLGDLMPVETAKIHYARHGITSSIVDI